MEETTTPRQLQMALEAGSRPRRRRAGARRSANRPVRGEADVPTPPLTDWRIDRDTKAQGLRGLERARAALSGAPSPRNDDEQVHAA